MKGITLLVYVLFFTIMFFFERASFFAVAGSLNGVPVQVNVVVSKLGDAITTGQQINPPRKMVTFISGCDYPTHEKLDAKDVRTAEEGCKNARGIVCVFYPYYTYKYRMCKGLRYTPDKTYYFDGKTSPIYQVGRNLKEHSVSFERVYS